MKPALVLVIMAAFLAVSSVNAFADPLRGAVKQRIGNYDLEMTTLPKTISVGGQTTVMLRFSGVNGDDLIDVPMTVAISKDVSEVYRSKPAIVPYGHYSFNYTFPQPGGYALVIYLTDNAYSGQILNITFPLTVVGASEQALGTLPVVGAIAAAGVGALVVFRRRLTARH